MDTTGWTTYEPDEFVCVDARTGNVKTAGGIKPVLILELYNDEKQLSITKFFNCNKSKKGNISVNKNSDFARLYRTTIGTDPRPRYSKAKQLLGHLIEFDFICEYEEAKDSKGALYFRATKIQPLESIVSEEWFSNGKLKNKRGSKGIKRPSRVVSNRLNQQSNEQSSGTDQARTKKKTGNTLETLIWAKPSYSNVLDANSGSYQHLTSLNSNVESLHHSEYVTVEVLSSKERFYHYHPIPNENENEYIERVLNDSISRW